MQSTAVFPFIWGLKAVSYIYLSYVSIELS